MRNENDHPFDWSEYPHVAGYKGTADTGIEAARDITPETGRLRKLVLHVVTQAGEHGATAEEICEATGVPRVSAQPRTSELSRLGKIVDSGKRRQNPSSGKRAIVWCLPEFKQEAAR